MVVRPPFAPRTSDFSFLTPLQGSGYHHVLNPDTFRGPFGKDDPNAASKYAWDVKNVIESCTPGKVAGYIAETIQGVGGAVELPQGYLKEVYDVRWRERLR